MQSEGITNNGQNWKQCETTYTREKSSTSSQVDYSQHSNQQNTLMTDELYQTYLAKFSGNKWYSDDDRIRALRILPGHEELVIAQGGFRLLVGHVGKTLTYVIPKAKSAGRGHLIMGESAFGDPIIIGGKTYKYDKYGRAKLVEVIKMVMTAWALTKGNIDKFYAAIGTDSGHCAICGSFLSDPVSKARGIGPECIKRVDAIRGIALVQLQRIEAQEADEIARKKRKVRF